MRCGKWFSTRATIHDVSLRLSRIRRLALAFVIVEALVQDPLDPTRIDLLLVFTGKANLNASSQAQVTRGGSFQSALGLDDVTDHTWVDDTVLYVWISFFCIGVIGVCVVKYETGHSVAGSLQFAAGRYTCIAGVRCVGAIGKSCLFLTLAIPFFRVSRTSQCRRSRSACCYTLVMRSSMSLFRRPWRRLSEIFIVCPHVRTDRGRTRTTFH